MSRTTSRSKVRWVAFAVIVLTVSALAYGLVACDDDAIPVEPDGGIGDTPIPVEPDGGIGDTPIPVEPDGGIGDTPTSVETAR